MNKTQQARFNSLYQQHVNALRRQGKSKTTVDAYSRALRRITEYFDRCPDRLTVEDLKEHCGNLGNSHSRIFGLPPRFPASSPPRRRPASVRSS